MISYDHLMGVVLALQTVMQNDDGDTFAGLQVVNMTNRFSVSPKERWSDVMFHIVFTDDGVPPQERVICEVQLSLMKLTMTRRDLGGHDAYSKFRCAVEIQRFVEAKMGQREV